MIYNQVIEGKFLERPNRFIGMVEVNGILEKVHVKNTGRCKELLICGATVLLECANNPNRKTKYSLIAVYKGSKLINMDSQVPNAVVYDALMAQKIPEIGLVSYAKREQTFGDSRYDIYYEKPDGKKGYIEIKGVTLEENGVVMFPDAPTKRGEKHVRGLMEACKLGYETTVFFLIQMSDVDYFIPNEKRDPALTKALRSAVGVGVKVIGYDALVTKNSIELGNSIPIYIDEKSCNSMEAKDE